MKKILFTLSVILTSALALGQTPVNALKADYYKDFKYTEENNGTPTESDTPIEILVTQNSWGLPADHEVPFPNNSLTPTEIKLMGNPKWFILNGSNENGKRFDFQAVPVEITGEDKFKGVVNGKYGNNETIGYGRKTVAQIEILKSQKSKNWFLTSGKHGMDLATGMANITGTVKFGVVFIDESRIDDPEPDFLFTQIAGPGDNKDKMYFVDANGNQVGNIIEIKFGGSTIPELGGSWRFIQYSPSNGPKPLKLVAFKISDFGINQSNYSNVRGLKYIPSGDSDPAFIAADRQSLFVYKKLNASISGGTIACKNSSAHITFRAVSETGVGPYKFTYEVTDINGGVTTQTTESTETGPYVETTITVPTSQTGAITYKLTKVEDLGIATGPNKEKSSLDEIHTVEIKSCDYVTTWKTTTANETITIPTFPGNSVTYNYTIKWEGMDANNSTANGTEVNVTGSKTLTFPIAGRYRVKIQGNFPYIYFNNSGDKDKILTVEQWGTTNWYSQENSYYGCKNLQISAKDKPILTQTTSLKNMFKDAYSLNSDISDWNTTNITNMEGMFDGARSFNQDLSKWNMGNVTRVNNMFRNSNMSANKLGLTLTSWANGVDNLTTLTSQQTLGENLRYCNNGVPITITNLTMPTEQCAEDKNIGNIYLEATNTANNHKRLAGILPNRAFEWLEEDVKVEGLTDIPNSKGIFKLAEGNGVFNFNGVTLDIHKQTYSNNNVLRGFNSLNDGAVFPLANMSYTYKKEGSTDGFSFSEVVNSLPEKNLSEEGIIVYSNGHFYEAIKVDSNNNPSSSGSLKWVRIDN